MSIEMDWRRDIGELAELWLDSYADTGVTIVDADGIGYDRGGCGVYTLSDGTFWLSDNITGDWVRTQEQLTRETIAYNIEDYDFVIINDDGTVRQIHYIKTPDTKENWDSTDPNRKGALLYLNGIYYRMTDVKNDTIETTYWKQYEEYSHRSSITGHPVPVTAEELETVLEDVASWTLHPIEIYENDAE